MRNYGHDECRVMDGQYSILAMGLCAGVLSLIKALDIMLFDKHLHSYIV